MYLIFSDVDKTMIDDNLHLLDQTLANIKTARHHGMLFAICTGNSHLENMVELANHVGADFLITSDGTRAYDMNQKQIIYKQLIPAQTANKLFKSIEKFANYITWTTETMIHISANSEASKKLAVATNKKYNCKSANFAFSNHIIDDVYKFSCYGPKVGIDKIKRELASHNVSFLRHNDSFLTISALNCDKGQAAKAVAKYKNIVANNIMVVGDGANDIAMFKITKYSYAVANGIKSLRDIANYHTSSVDQNGLGEAIVDFMYRQKITS